jgi:hypothetical protein
MKFVYSPSASTMMVYSGSRIRNFFHPKTNTKQEEGKNNFLSIFEVIDFTKTENKIFEKLQKKI